MGDLRSFLQRAKQPRYTIPERVRTHPTGASGRSARHDAQPSAFSIRTDGSRAPVLSATPDTTSTPHTRKIRLARKIRRPGKSAGQEHPPARNIVRPGNPPQPGNPPARPSFHPAPVLSGFVPLRSPSPARFTPLPPPAATRAAHRPSRRMACPMSRGGAAPVQICRPDRMPRQKERQPAGAAALRQSDSGPIICC